MSPETWLLFVGTVLVFMATPGPSHLLMLSNSLTHGFARAWPTGAGDLSANLLQMLAAGLGLAALVTSSGAAFEVVRWAGAAYLVGLGLWTIWKAGRGKGAAATGPSRDPRFFWQGFLTSASNPKAIAIVFFAALFPQFLDPGLAFAPQFAALSATYLVIDGAFLAVYGAGAGQLRVRLASTAGLQRIGGAVLVAAGVLLGLRGVSR